MSVVVHSPTSDTVIERARFVRIEDEITRRGVKLRKSGAELVGPCPKCGEGDDRFAINIKKQVWNCRLCKTGGDVIDLAQHVDGVDFMTACRQLANEPQQSSKDQNHEGRKVKIAEFKYLDAAGTMAFVVDRYEFQKPDGSFVLKEDGKHEKKFSRRRPDPRGNGSWIWNVDGAPVVPYRLPELIEAVANSVRF